MQLDDPRDRGVDAPGGIISNGALAWSDGGKPIETSNTNLAVSTALHPGTYYWQVIPVDSQGHNGTPSAIFSFAWIWAGIVLVAVVIVAVVFWVVNLTPPTVDNAQSSRIPDLVGVSFETGSARLDDLGLTVTLLSLLACSGPVCAAPSSEPCPVLVIAWAVLALDPS